MTDKPMLKITVDARALEELLRAVIGPPHYIRELQAARGLPGNNCIDQLQREFNAALNASQEPEAETDVRKIMLSVDMELLVRIATPLAKVADGIPRRVAIRELRALLNTPNLRADQPVAVVEMCRAAHDPVYVKRGVLTEAAYDKVGAGAELYAAPQPGRLPRRKTVADYKGYIEPFQAEAAALYNEALDDVAKLWT